MIRVVIADDEALVRGGLKMILEAEPDIKVVGEVDDGSQAIDEIVTKSPDVVVMDIRMPGLTGIEVTERLASRPTDAKVLIVTTFHLDEYVLAALRAGADGFLLKDSAPELLVDAVRTVAAGDALLSPAVTRQLIEHYVKQPSPDRALEGRVAELTERELEVTRLIARGLTNAQIGEQLFLGEATVKSYVTAIFGKLGVSNRAQVVVAAYESGLVRAGESGNDT